MEDFFVIGTGWSGNLHLYDNGRNPIILYWWEHGVPEAGHIQVFERLEDVEQYIDALDMEWDDFQQDALPVDEATIEMMEDLIGKYETSS